MRTTRLWCWVSVLSWLTAPFPLAAQEASITYLYGFNWSSGGAQRDVLSVEYAAAWRYGDNYFLFESYEMLAARDTAATGPTPSIYGEWHPRISLTKISNGDLALGPLTNISLAGEVNLANDFSAVLYGVGLDWRTPDATWLFTNLYRRDDRSLEGATWHLLVATGGTLPLAAQRIQFFGFVDAFGREGTRSGMVYGELQVLLDVARLVTGAPGEVWGGIELHVSQNAFGSDSGAEFVPQLAVKLRI